MSLAGRPQKPELINECSRSSDYHLDDCDQKCAKVERTALEQLLAEERQRWTDLDMPIQGIPDSFQHVGIQGIGINLFELECRLMAIIDTLTAADPSTQQQLTEAYQQRMLNKLRTIREAVEPGLKKARAEALLGIAQQKIIGADGRPLH